MNTDSESTFVDSNIIVYAHDAQAGERHRLSRELILECMEGKRIFYVSNQILGEVVNVIKVKLPHLPPEIPVQIIEDILHIPSWKKLNYSEYTVKEALKLSAGKSFWDAVIAQTMIENGITKIYTENTKDFSKIKGIKAVNPFHSKSIYKCGVI